MFAEIIRNVNHNYDLIKFKKKNLNISTGYFAAPHFITNSQSDGLIDFTLMLIVSGPADTTAACFASLFIWDVALFGRS